MPAPPGSKRPIPIKVNNMAAESNAERSRDSRKETASKADSQSEPGAFQNELYLARFGAGSDWKDTGSTRGSTALPALEIKILRESSASANADSGAMKLARFEGHRTNDQKNEVQLIKERSDGKLGIGTLGVSTEQLARTIKRLDAEIWETDSSSPQEKERVSNLKDLQKSLSAGRGGDPLLQRLSDKSAKNGDAQIFEKQYPEGMLTKINSYLIGESANEIFKQAQLKGDTSRFAEKDRLLKEAVLSVQLGRLPSAQEYKDNLSKVESTLANLKKEYDPPKEWTNDDHRQVANAAKDQVSRSEHWSENYAKATNNGRLACGAFITSGRAARDTAHGIVPSLDLNVNGIVGESLIRGFQPRTTSDALRQGQETSTPNAMALVIRTPRLANGMEMASGGNGHIGFLHTNSGEVMHNSSARGVGIKERIGQSSSFPTHSYVLVPPGWEKLAAKNRS